MIKYSDNIQNIGINLAIKKIKKLEEQLKEKDKKIESLKQKIDFLSELLKRPDTSSKP
jgi:predicted RNase H-like nuclease (RuvC/YqgF family)